MLWPSRLRPTWVEQGRTKSLLYHPCRCKPSTTSKMSPAKQTQRRRICGSKFDPALSIRSAGCACLGGRILGRLSQRFPPCPYGVSKALELALKSGPFCLTVRLRKVACAKAMWCSRSTDSPYRMRSFCGASYASRYKMAKLCLSTCRWSVAVKD